MILIEFLLIITSMFSFMLRGCFCLKPMGILYKNLSFVYFSFLGYEITDLDMTGEDFDTQASQWTANGVFSFANSTVNDCDGTQLLGGFLILDNNPGSYFERIYTDLPEHNMIYYSFDFWIFDSWDITDSFDITFDSTVIDGWKFAKEYFPQEMLCGNEYWADLPNITIVGRTSHNLASLTLRMLPLTSDNSNDESFGFRNVNLIFLNRTEVETSAACAKASIALPAQECPCDAQVYLDFSSSSTCGNCSAYCASCFGPNPEDCFQCVDGHSFINQQCTGCSPGCIACHGTGPQECDTCEADKFLAWDNSCIDTCDFPLTSVTLPNGYQECIYPCQSSEHLYWNGSCLSSCDSPFFSFDLAGGAHFCSFPCGSDDFLAWDGNCYYTCPPPLISNLIGTVEPRKFCELGCSTSSNWLYWNESCYPTCNLPLHQTTWNGVQICDFPCDDSSDFLYWDGTCSSFCIRPLSTRTEGTSEIRKFCDFGCTTQTDFLYWDGSCSATCGELLVSRSEHSRNFCNHPCEMTSTFIFANITCLPDCPFPFQERLEPPAKYCDSPCLADQWFYWNSSCHDTCDFPLTSRTEGELNFCDYKCINTSEFLHWDGTCQPSCDPPLSQKIEGDVKFCYIPCSDGGFLYWDEFCSSVCPFPLTQNVVNTDTEVMQFCDFNCPSAADYLYWDGSCSSSCPYPLVASTYHSRTFCLYPCESSDDFIYWNNTCHSTCPLPYKTHNEGLLNFCDLPCSQDEFIFPDGSCDSTCKSPLSIRVINDVKFCDYLCTSQEYLFWDGSCVPSCEFPLQSEDQNGFPFCNLPCSSPYEYYYEAIGSCNLECTAPNTIKNRSLYIACGPPEIIDDGEPDPKTTPEDNTSTNPGSLTNAEAGTGTLMNTGILIDTVMSVPNEPTTVVLILSVKLLQYIRYLDVAYPPELKKMLIKNGNSMFILNFGPRISSGIQSGFEDSSIPPMFERYNQNSSFLVDFWQVMTTLGILLVIVCLITVSEKVSNHYKIRSAKIIIDQLKVILKWNFVLIIFICNIEEIILFSALELRSLDLVYSVDLISLLSCILMLISIPTIMIGSFYLSRFMKKKGDKALEQGSQVNYITYAIKYQRYQVLWSGFKADTFLRQSFMSICIGRIVIVYLIASVLYSVPLLQAIFYFIISIIFLAYLIRHKPLKRKLNQIQLCVYESITLLVNFSIFLLAALDTGHTKADQFRIFLGSIIIFCHLALNLTASCFLGIKIFNRFRKIYRLYKKSHKFGKRGCFQLFLLPLQQITMGFEKISTLLISDRQIQKDQGDSKGITLKKNKSKTMRRFSLFSPQNSILYSKRLSITATPLASSGESNDISIRSPMKSSSIMVKHLSIEHFNRKMSLSEPNPEDPENLINEDELLQKKKLYGSSGSIPPESPEKGSSGSSQENDSNEHRNKEVNSNSPDLTPSGVIPQNPSEVQRLSLKEDPKQSEEITDFIDISSQQEPPLMKDELSLKVIKADKFRKLLAMLNGTEKLEEVDSYLESSFNQQGGEGKIADSQRSRQDKDV